jgi:large subunit ribosomal protein L17
MRHGNKVNHLGRKTAHRKALLRNLAIGLLISPKKRIFTTVAKAKALRTFVEPLITKSKDNTTHSRRVAFSYLQNKEAIKELFGTVADKIGDRPGGYTRILKIGNRVGDNAEMALIELVDFNEFAAAKPKKKSSRRKKKTTGGAEKKPAADLTKAEVVEAKTEKKAGKKAEPAKEEPAAEVPTVDLEKKEEEKEGE